MNFPKPPGYQDTSPQKASSGSLEVNTPSMDVMNPKRDGKLSDDEYGFILDATLKPKHRKDESVLSFIDSFIKCKDIRQASAECGINYSVGYQYRHRLDIANAIQKLIDKSAVKYGFDASEIMERTKEIVSFDPIMLQNPDGTFKSKLHDIDPAARRNLKKLKVKNLWTEIEDMNGMKKNIICGEVIEYEFYDKLKAIELSGKEKELFKTTTKVEHGITENMANILLESARRGQEKSLEFSKPKVVESYVVEKPVTEEENDEYE